MADIRELFADNDFSAGDTITDDAGTPATGLTVLAFISATKDRATAITIHSELSLNLTETPASSGIYEGVIQGDKITARLLPTYLNRLVYLIRKAGTDYFTYRTCIVRDYRPAE